MNGLLESINQLGVLLLLLSTFFYYLHLRKVRRERKLTSLEFTMFITTQIAYLLWAGSLLIHMLDKG